MDTSPASLCHRFGATIRRERLRAKLTQEELAERADLSTRWVQMIETGGPEPGLVRIAKLAQGLGIAPHVLLKRAGL